MLYVKNTRSLLFEGLYPDEPISAYCYRKNYWKRVAMIDWAMCEENHCAMAYLSEQHGTQNAPEYRTPDYRAKFEEESQ